MRVFVIGGTGFIGFHAVQELLRRGHAVTVLTRRLAYAETLFGPQVRCVAGDLDTVSMEDWPALLADHQGLLFAAGVDERSRPLGDPLTFFHRMNVLPTQQVLDAAEVAGLQRAVVIGSVFSWLHQAQPELMLTTHHPYIHSRVAQEAVALAAGRRLVVSVLQLPYVFGQVPPGQRCLWEPLVHYVRTPVPLMSTAGGANAIAVNRVAEAIAGALERPQASAAYAVGDENLLWRDLLLRLCDAVGRHEQRVLSVSNPAFRDLTRTGAWMKQLFRMDSGLDTGQLMDLLTRNIWFDPEPACRALGHERGGLEQALRDTAASCPERAAARRWRRFWDWVATGQS